MQWAIREYSDSQIDAAGKVLISRRSSPADTWNALDIINNWRAAHAFPLNTMQMRLRNKAYEIDRRSPTIGQRIKRLPAIDSKLRRLRNVSLAIMQDIGGCRAIVASPRAVNRLRRAYKAGRIRHELERENDYINSPTSDGYRGVHLIYRYYSDRNTQYDGQRIEIQLRSRLQHAWATAVESIDTFAGQQLKINLGDEDWARFFALMGSCIALREKSPVIPDTPNNERELGKELRDLAYTLNVEYRLLALRATARYLERGMLVGSYHYYLLDLDLKARNLSVAQYMSTDVQIASTRLAELEAEYQNNPEKDVLLVSVRSIKELRKAYPNYFADTDVFLGELRRILR